MPEPADYLLIVDLKGHGSSCCPRGHIFAEMASLGCVAGAPAQRECECETAWWRRIAAETQSRGGRYCNLRRCCGDGDAHDARQRRLGMPGHRRVSNGDAPRPRKRVDAIATSLDSRTVEAQLLPVDHTPPFGTTKLVEGVQQPSAITRRAQH